MAQITYENKVKINDSSLPAVNKVRDVDMNEIKEVVNENDDNLGDLSLLNTINKSNIVGAINEIVDRNVFSTDEKIIGKWINDKPIYRKIINLGNLSSASETVSYAHGIANIDTFTKIEGMVNNGQEWFPFNSVFRGATTFDYDLGLLANKVNIVYTTKTNRSAYQGWVLLEYTKTTD